MKMNYLFIFLLSILLVGCGCGGGKLTVKNTPVIGTLTVSPIAHNNAKYYVANLSDTPYFMAVAVSNNSKGNATINNITLTDSINFSILSTKTTSVNGTQSYSSNYSKYFPSGSTTCAISLKLEPNQSCEILIKLNNANQVSNATAQLQITTSNNQIFTKQLTKRPIAYIAGNFSQTYGSNPIINQTINPSYGNCGVNNNALCTILQYDIESNTVTNIAQTDYAINNIVSDENGLLYIAGDFDTAFTQNQTVYGPDPLSNSTFILTLNPTNNNITDFIKNINPNYTNPDDTIYALAYNNNKLYMTGSFESVGNYISTNGYPIIQYDFTNNNFNNAFGTDNNNPNAIVTTIGFDNESNLYVSGIYSSISNFINLQPFGIYSINKCTLSNGIYTCNNNQSDYYLIDSTTTNQPASSITFDLNDNMYSGGGFSQINGNIGIANAESFIVAFNNYASWQNLTTSTQAPDRAIGVIQPTNNSNSYYIGGWFSTIGGLPVNQQEQGQCGLAFNQQSNGINSCMLALYNGTDFSKVFTTDGMINTFSISSQLTID